MDVSVIMVSRLAVLSAPELLAPLKLFSLSELDGMSRVMKREAGVLMVDIGGRNHESRVTGGRRRKRKRWM